MNEIKHIELGRQPFTISIAAHKELRAYIEAIEAASKKDAEVVKEVELRMAELLTERGLTADKVVLKEDVEFIQSQLGEPSDFKDDNQEAESQAQASVSDKRLYRDVDNGLLAGVSSGLAAYFGIGATAVRLLFVLFSVFSFVGVVVYLVLWLIVPETKTQADRLRLKGKQVTVQSLKEMASAADVPGAAKRARRVMAPAIVGIAKLLIKLIGVGFIIAAILLLLIVAGLISYFVVRGNLGAGVVITDFGTSAWLVLVASGLAASMLAIILVIMGLTLVRQKKAVAGWISALLVAVLLVSSTATAVAGFDMHEKFQAKKQQLTAVAPYEVKPFSRFNLIGESTLVTYQPSDRYYVELKSIGKKYDYSTLLKQKDGELSLDTLNLPEDAECGIVCPFVNQITEVRLHSPALESVSIGGYDNKFQVFKEDGAKIRQDTMKVTVRSQSNVIDMFGMSVRDVQTSTEYDAQTVRHFVLSGLGTKGGLSDATVRYAIDDFELDRITDTIKLDGVEPCKLTSPMLVMSVPPKEIIINNKSYEPFNGISSKQSFRNQNVANCIGFKGRVD